MFIVLFADFLFVLFFRCIKGERRAYHPEPDGETANLCHSLRECDRTGNATQRTAAQRRGYWPPAGGDTAEGCYQWGSEWILLRFAEHKMWKFDLERKGTFCIIFILCTVENLQNLLFSRIKIPNLTVDESELQGGLHRQSVDLEEDDKDSNKGQYFLCLILYKSLFLLVVCMTLVVNLAVEWGRIQTSIQCKQVLMCTNESPQVETRRVAAARTGQLRSRTTVKAWNSL